MSSNTNLTKQEFESLEILERAGCDSNSCASFGHATNCSAYRASLIRYGYPTDIDLQDLVGWWKGEALDAIEKRNNK